MRLLRCNNDGEYSLVQFFNNDIPPYAIFSHTWGDEEVTFRDLIDGTGKSKAGYAKILFCSERAKREGLQYFWVDVCCIDKSNAVELQEAIYSMFDWYQNAVICYVYLSDVCASDLSPECTWELQFRSSRWFTRGWTLQELLAPSLVEFFSIEGIRLGDRQSLEREIHEMTGIAIDALRGRSLSQFSVVARLSWTLGRLTTREEDSAYSLLGLFGVQMPLLFGEGKVAMARLMEEIIKATEDYSILLWFNQKAASFQSRSDPIPHDNDQLEDQPSWGAYWEALEVYSPIDLMSTKSLRRYLSPSDQVPEPPQISSRGLRVSLYARRVRSSLIAWTYCTKERNGQLYAVCLRLLSEGTVTEANRHFHRRTFSGDVYYVKVNRLKGFRLCVIYITMPEFLAL